MKFSCDREYSTPSDIWNACTCASSFRTFSCSTRRNKSILKVSVSKGSVSHLQRFNSTEASKIEVPMKPQDHLLLSSWLSGSEETGFRLDPVQLMMRPFSASRQSSRCHIRARRRCFYLAQSFKNLSGRSCIDPLRPLLA